MRNAVLAAQPQDWRLVVEGLDRLAAPIVYEKHMTHHMVAGFGLDWTADRRNAFLIRDPAEMIASYLRKRESAAFEDFGLDRQADFFEREADRLGEAPPVVDAGDVLADPEGVLTALCGRLGVAFDPAMLHWPPGRRPTDGPWAPHWYRAVEASTGFGPPEAPPAVLPDDAHRLADRCRPCYERLWVHRIMPAKVP